MISYEEAIRIIDEHCRPMPAERIHVSEARGRFLAEEVAAKCDSPPFANSAVDGFGRRLEDLSVRRLILCDSVKAGDDGRIHVPPGQTVQVFTGAPIPRGIAAVSMQEDCVLEAEHVTFSEISKEGDNIRPAGDDVRAGQSILRKGTRLGAAALAMAVSGGVKDVKVVGIPSVSLLTTGSELVDINDDLQPGKIYDSNHFALSTAVNELHDQWTIATSSDKPEVLRKRMEKVMQGAVVITCGGVSVGEHDLMKEEFAFWGVQERFWRVAIKPGKPIYFGTVGEKLVFGLPGNPVSALVTYFLFARPAILKLMGHPNPWPKPIQARFEGEKHKDPIRMEFLRGTVAYEEGMAVARCLTGQGSHMMAAMANANCLIHFPREATELKTGDVVEVTPLNWGTT